MSPALILADGFSIIVKQKDLTFAHAHAKTVTFFNLHVRMYQCTKIFTAHLKMKQQISTGHTHMGCRCLLPITSNHKRLRSDTCTVSAVCNVTALTQHHVSAADLSAGYLCLKGIDLRHTKELSHKQICRI